MLMGYNLYPSSVRPGTWNLYNTLYSHHLEAIKFKTFLLTVANKMFQTDDKFPKEDKHTYI